MKIVLTSIYGKPRIFKIGFTIKFNIPKTIANKIALPNPSKCTPLKTKVNAKATAAVNNKLIIVFIGILV